MIPIRKSSIATLLLSGMIAAGGFAQDKGLKPSTIRPNISVQTADAILLARPDLVVSLTCNSKATAGTDLAVSVKVTNQGTVKAIGTIEGPANKAYMVDLVWSSDSVIPMKTAVQPVYQGLTKEDFVEDMLVLGGRLSNTQSIPPGQSVTYNLPAYVPKNMAPGVYWLGAYVDSIGHVAELREGNNTTSHKVQIGTSLGSNTQVPAGVNLWVMPWGIGGTPLYKIKPTGLTDYTDGLSAKPMVNAPFGGFLGFRHGFHDSIPTPQIHYYRWQCRPLGTSVWQDFTESVGVHYVRQIGASVSFPVYPLGPKNVDGKNLYEFRPHNAPVPTLPGETTGWPATDWFGDIYSGLLNSPALTEGTYQFKLDVFSSTGTQVMPGAATFRFLAPTSTAADGTVNTALATTIEDGGYVFTLHIDNRRCNAAIDAPKLGGDATTDACGFLLYDPTVPPASAEKVSLAFHGTHPGNYAVFSYNVIRANTPVIDLVGEVTAPNIAGFTGDGQGNFSNLLTRNQLLGTCVQGAFAEGLYVYPKATNGWGQRLTTYDASAWRAFALAPK